MSSPAIEPVPDVDLVNPQSIRIVVVLPAPFTPKTRRSPRRTDIEISRVAFPIFSIDP
jgi:hypothetical protein